MERRDDRLCADDGVFLNGERVCSAGALHCSIASFLMFLCCYLQEKASQSPAERLNRRERDDLCSDWQERGCRGSVCRHKYEREQEERMH